MRQRTEQSNLDESHVVHEWSRMLNGPRGKTVLESLDEGESFILQTSRQALRVTKVRGRAVVEQVTLQ